MLIFHAIISSYRQDIDTGMEICIKQVTALIKTLPKMQAMI